MIHQGIRERLEEREGSLSPGAARSRLTRGRLRPEEPCPMRTEFQRDRDRILHAKAFRRLKHKTQVFIAPTGDHYVTRLTHTLEVAQIARSIARALNLNEDLTEAIALGHDLGHTPFGHIGEEALAELYPGGFRHNEQSLRVVDLLEKEGQGLNLTCEVRDGILKHAKGRQEVEDEGEDLPATLEGQVCRLADLLAYINHDIDDALRAGLITFQDLPLEAVALLGESHSRRLNTLICDIVDSSWAVTGLVEGRPLIRMGPAVLAAANQLRDFLFERVYDVCAALKEARQARETLSLLYHYYNRHPDEMPLEYRPRGEEVARQVVDFVAGMTDRYALSQAAELCSAR